MKNDEFLENVKELTDVTLNRANELLKPAEHDIKINWDYYFVDPFDRNVIGVYEADSVFSGTMSIGMNIDALWRTFKSETKRWSYSSEYTILDEMIMTNVCHEMGHGLIDLIEDYLSETDEFDHIYDENKELFDDVLDNDSVEKFAWSTHDNDLEESDLYKIFKLMFPS